MPEKLKHGQSMILGISFSRLDYDKKLLSRKFCHWYLISILKISSVIRQKGESQKGVSRKQSTPNFPKNEHFLSPDTHTYMCVSGSKKCLFFGKFGMLCFLETPALRLTLLPYYQRSVVFSEIRKPWMTLYGLKIRKIQAKI